MSLASQLAGGGGGDGGSGSAMAASSTASNSKFDVWCSLLYAECEKTGDPTRLYTQQDLLDFNVIPNRELTTLLNVIQRLSNDWLLSAVNTKDGLAWRWREASEAEKYKICTTQEQKMVFAAIDDAGDEGIWQRTLERRLNMNEKVVRTALKFLQAKNLVKPFTVVENPNKKMFIKASIQPSERATGGPWFTDQMLDEAFIEELQRVIYDFVKKQSTYHSRHGGSTSSGSKQQALAQPRKGIMKGSASSIQARKRPAEQISSGAEDASVGNTNGAQQHAQQPAASKRDVLLPFPAGYISYPTVRDIARFIHNAGITTNTVLGESDVQTLLDVLVYDSVIEPVRTAGRLGYRTTRIARQSIEHWAGRKDEDAAERAGPAPTANGYTEMPCSTCPNLAICGDGGPVSPTNCVYFKKWLDLDF